MNSPIVPPTKYRRCLILPDRTFACWIHWCPERTVVRPGEFFRVAERPYHSYRPRWMNCRSDFGQRIFRSHRSAPDLRVIQEKQLIVRKVDAGQSRLFAVTANPFFVRLLTRSITEVHSKYSIQLLIDSWSGPGRIVECNFFPQTYSERLFKSAIVSHVFTLGHAAVHELINLLQFIPRKII